VSVTVYHATSIPNTLTFHSELPVTPFRTPCMFFMSGDRKRTFRQGDRNEKVVPNVSFPIKCDRYTKRVFCLLLNVIFLKVLQGDFYKKIVIFFLFFIL
jgi:hypothetical protein